MRTNKPHNVIMVVDDDMFVRRVVADTLKEFAHVIEIGDGDQVLKHYRAHMPDMVFLDIHLPNQSGLQLLEQIRKIDPQAYVVMLSADSTTGNIKQSSKFGIKGFLTKPFKRARIISHLRQCPTIRFIKPSL